MNTLKTLMDLSDLLRTSGDFSSARTVVPETPEPVLSSNQNIVFKAKKTKQRRVPARLSVPLSLKQPPAEPCEASQAPRDSALCRGAATLRLGCMLGLLLPSARLWGWSPSKLGPPPSHDLATGTTQDRDVATGGQSWLCGNGDCNGHLFAATEPTGEGSVESGTRCRARPPRPGGLRLGVRLRGMEPMGSWAQLCHPGVQWRMPQP